MHIRTDKICIIYGKENLASVFQYAILLFLFEVGKSDQSECDSVYYNFKNYPASPK